MGVECSVSGLYQGQHPSCDKTVLQCYKCYHWGKQGKGYLGSLCVLSYNYNCLKVQTLIFSSRRTVLSEATLAVGGPTWSVRRKKVRGGALETNRERTQNERASAHLEPDNWSAGQGPVCDHSLSTVSLRR